MLYNPDYYGLIKKEYEKRGYICVNGVVCDVENVGIDKNTPFDKNGPLGYYPMVVYKIDGKMHKGRAFLINDSKRPDIGRGKKVQLFFKKDEPNRLFGINKCVFDDDGEIRNPDISELIWFSIKKKFSKLFKNS